MSNHPKQSIQFKEYAMPQKILTFKPKALQRGLKTNLDYQPKSYIRHAGEPKPVSRIEFAGYCHA